MTEFTPYRMTTTISFHHCVNEDALVSPPTHGEMYAIAEKFIRLLQQAGFNVATSEKPPVGSADQESISAAQQFVSQYEHSFVRFFMDGVACGYTMGVVLHGSDVSIHTYPEYKYGACFELEFNLCYLWEEMRDLHDLAMRCVVGLFAEWLQVNVHPEIDRSSIRRFRPVT